MLAGHLVLCSDTRTLIAEILGNGLLFYFILFFENSFSDFHEIMVIDCNYYIRLSSFYIK